jgi:mannitol-1-phosphate/altronate dehydrogenase
MTIKYFPRIWHFGWGQWVLCFQKKDSMTFRILKQTRFEYEEIGVNEAKCSLVELENQENDRTRWFKEAMIHGYVGNEFYREAK